MLKFLHIKFSNIYLLFKSMSSRHKNVCTMYLHVTPKSATVQNKMFESDIIATQMYFSIAFTYKWSQTRVSSTDLQVRTALQSLVKILRYSSYLNDHKEGITH